MVGVKGVYRMVGGALYDPGVQRLRESHTRHTWTGKDARAYWPEEESPAYS